MFSSTITASDHRKEGLQCTEVCKEQDQRKITDVKEQEIISKLCQVDLQIQQWKEHITQHYNGDGSTLQDWKSAIKEISENQCSDEVSLVLEKIHKQEQLKQELTCHLKEVQAAKECAVIMQAWQRNKEFLSTTKSKTCWHDVTPLYAWYVQLSQAVLDSRGAVNPQQKRHVPVLSVSDRLCYNLKYDSAVQSPLLVEATNRKNEDMLTTQQPGNKWLEVLSFCTRRKGICVNIVLGKLLRSRKENNQAQGLRTPDDDEYTVLFDPHIQGLEKDLKDNFLQRRDPCVFLTDFVWPVIDLCGFW